MMHYYQFHIGDYRAGTVHLTQIERWVYRDLLDCLYDTEEPLPLDVDKVCMMVGARSDEHKDAVKVVLFAKFKETEQGYTNSRFEEELDKYRSKAQRAIDANKKRWGYKNDLKSDVKSDADQIATNNQEPITNNHSKAATGVAKPDGVSKELWSEFNKICKSKNKPIGELVLKKLYSEADKAGWSIDRALTWCCEKGYARFEAEWVKGDTAKPMTVADMEKAMFK